MKLRLLSRGYLGLTALFYLLVGVLLALPLAAYTAVPTQHAFWAGMFILAGLMSFVGWFDKRYWLAKPALLLASSIAGGFSLLFWSKVAGGNPEHVIVASMWSYIAGSHALYSRLPDPYVLALFEHEVAGLQKRIRNTNG